MAQVYTPPEHIKSPVLGDGVDQYIEKVASFCKENSKCPHAGEVIWFPIADGKAMYIVYDYKTLLLLEVGDVYQIPDAHASGLRKADIIKKINQANAMKKLFGGG
jgi:hypothetical protein